MRNFDFFIQDQLMRKSKCDRNYEMSDNLLAIDISLLQNSNKQILQYF